MRIRLILFLSLFGVAMGFATVFYISSAIEPYYWLGIFVFTAIIIAKYCDEKYFLHGFLVSLLNSVWITIIHVSLFDTYSANHPEYMQMLGESSMAEAPKLMMILTGPMIGAVSGLVLGLFSFIAGKIIRTRL